MNRQGVFVSEYQRLTGAHYRDAHMVWVKAVLEGNRELINMYIDHAEQRKARLVAKYERAKQWEAAS